MTMVAATPARPAAQARARPWLPELDATTPRARSSAVRSATLFRAPLALKDPVTCAFSIFPRISRPSGEGRASRGVARTCSAMRSCAAALSIPKKDASQGAAEGSARVSLSHMRRSLMSAR